jgi:hypothetical protein
MVNGRDDCRFPVLSSQEPLFHLLGTPEKDKKHVILDGGHVTPVGRPDVMKAILDWLDRYLGPVRSMIQRGRTRCCGASKKSSPMRFAMLRRAIFGSNFREPASALPFAREMMAGAQRNCGPGTA